MGTDSPSPSPRSQGQVPATNSSFGPRLVSPSPHGAILAPMAKQENGLASLEVLDPQGQAVALASLWSTQPLVLAYVRHFG